jgi:hypothetical protein
MTSESLETPLAVNPVQAMMDTLHLEGERTVQFFLNLPAATWTVPIYTDPLVWTPRHILVHLIDAENNFQRILENGLHGGEGAPAVIDVDRHNADNVPRLFARWSAESNAQVITRLQMIRGRFIETLSAFSPAMLANPIRHPLLDVMSTSDFARVVYMHCKLHCRDIRLTLQAQNLL